MEQVYAADYISADAKRITIEKGYGMWIAGGNAVTVKSAASKPSGFKAYDGNMVLGGFSETGDVINKKVEVIGAAVDEDVYGGMAMEGKSAGNTVTITKGTVGGDIYGGQSDGALVEKNKVTLTNVVAEQDVYGGNSDEQIARANTVTITGGSVQDSVYGGYSNVSASVNTVNIKGAKLNYAVYGGYSETGHASANVVNFTDSVFVKGFGSIYGGQTKSSEDGSTSSKTDGNTVKVNIGIKNVKLVGVYGGEGIGSAQNNKVIVTSSTAEKINTIIGGSVNGKGMANSNLVLLKGAVADSVTGGGHYKDGSVTNNNLVVLAGAKVDVDVTGGSADGAKNNSVVLVGKNGSYNVVSPDGKYKETVNSVKGNIIGRILLGGKSTGNALKVYGLENKVANLEGFQKLEFTLPKGDNKDKDMLLITSPNNAATTLKNVETITVTAANGAILSKGNKVNLIHKKDNGALNLLDKNGKAIFSTATGKAVNKNLIVVSSPLKATSGEMTLEKLEGTVRNDLVFTAKENIVIAGSDEMKNNSKSTLETRANGAALLNEGADFLMDRGIANAKLAAESGKQEFVPFAVVGGGSMRYNTGSHIDSRSWHGAVGLSKQVGKLVYGVVAEHGRNNYDSYVATAHGEGKSRATGGAVFAELQQASGIHYEAAVRAGRIKNDYSAQLSLFGEKQSLGYAESSTYYGVSLGMGKEVSLGAKDKVDFYGRYYWSHTNSSEVGTGLGDSLDFEAMNSHRLRVGSRYSHQVKEQHQVYAGLAWQYEFSGKAGATVNGESCPEPSLKGHSGMLELGWKAQVGKSLTVDLNANGWLGKQRGVAGGVELQWSF